MSNYVALHSISLFSGYGGLDIGVNAGLGGIVRTVCHVEREAHAAAILAARMEEGALAPAPVWSDITTFDAGAWRGKVDLVTAGFPCPPVSVAGRRKGVEDERWLWPEVERVVRESGAWLVALENVRGLVSDRRAIGDVLGGLADLGFTAEWLCIRASDVGASHRRERWFCLAHHKSRGCGIIGSASGISGYPDERCARVADGYSKGSPIAECPTVPFGPTAELCGAPVGDASRDNRRRGEWTAEEGSGPCTVGRRRPTIAGVGMDNAASSRHGSGQPDESGEIWCESWRPEPDRRSNHMVPVAGCERDERQRGVGELRAPQGQPQGKTQELQWGGGAACGVHQDPGRGVFAPGPDFPEWRAVIAEHPWLAPAFDAAQPVVRRVADGPAVRMDAERYERLRALGNGVIPQQAAAAFAELARRLKTP